MLKNQEIQVVVSKIKTSKNQFLKVSF